MLTHMFTLTHTHVHTHTRTHCCTNHHIDLTVLFSSEFIWCWSCWSHSSWSSCNSRYTTLYIAVYPMDKVILLVVVYCTTPFPSLQVSTLTQISSLSTWGSPGLVWAASPWVPTVAAFCLARQQHWEQRREWTIKHDLIITGLHFHTIAYGPRPGYEATYPADFTHSEYNFLVRRGSGNSRRYILRAPGQREQ